MKDVLLFLSENSIQYLATVDSNGLPKVRPFMILSLYNDKIYFAVSTDKEVYKEIKNNPRIEFSSSSPTFDWIRVSGVAKFIDDKDLLEKLINESEISESVYKKSKEDNVEVFCIDDVSIIFYDAYNKAKKIIGA